MGKGFVQSDTASGCGTAVKGTHGILMTAVPAHKLCVEGGDVGVSATSFRCRNTGISLFFEFVPGVEDWGDSEDYVVPVRITTAVSSTITSAYVVRVSSACDTPSNVCQVTGLSISINSTGVKTITIPATASTGNADDKCRIEIATTTGTTPLDAAFVPDQTITTPIEDAVVVRPQLVDGTLRTGLLGMGSLGNV